MTIVGVSQLEWDEAIYCLYDLLPSSYEVVNSPERFWSGFITKAAAQSGIPFDYKQISGWESYSWGFIELTEEAIFNEIFGETEIPCGFAIVVRDSRYMQKERDLPERMPTSVLFYVLDDWPNDFYSTSDIVFLFPEARRVTTLNHDGWFTHIACPAT